MTLPRETLDELLSMVRVSFDAQGTLTLLIIPSDRELAKVLPLIGGKQLSHSYDEIRVELEQALKLALPKWRAASRVAKPPPIQVKKLPEGVERFYAKPDDENLGPSNGAAEWEAKVRMMPYAELAMLCEANGLSYPTEAPNKGVLVMRARNCVYNALKAGKQLKSA